MSGTVNPRKKQFTEISGKYTKMELLYWIIAIVIVVISVVFIVLVHSGLLYTPIIRMSHPASMPRRVAYVLKQGPYKNCGTECNKIMKLSRGATTFGLFYDDPEKVNFAVISSLHVCYEHMLRFWNTDIQ